MIELVESSSAAERLNAASEFVGSFAPGTEVLVLGATRDAVDDFVRALSTRAAATFGLHRFSLTQLAAVAASVDLAERRLAPATALGSEALAARCVFDAGRESALSYFAPVSRFPGFVRALARTLTELRLTRVDCEGLRSLAGPGRDLARLYSLYADRLTDARVADRAELLDTAVRVVRAGAAPFARAVPVLLLDVEITCPAESELVGALLESSTAALAIVPAGDERTREALERIGLKRSKPSASPRCVSSLERLCEYLFSEATPPAAEIDGGVRFFSAPGEGREAVEIARYVLDEARAGMRFDEMAVFLRSPETYSGLLQTAFRRAGIPVFFARGTRRPDPCGRAFLALLACRSEGLSAKRFAEYLSFGQTPRLEADGGPPVGHRVWAGADDEALGPAAQRAQEQPPAGLLLDTEGSISERQPRSVRAPWKWEELLVDASVIGGHVRWERRLAGLESELRVRIEEAAEDDPESPRLRALERELDELGHLTHFALPVIERLAALPVEAPWSDWLAGLAELAPMVLARPERVLRVLSELQPMADVGPVSADEVRDVFGERLSFLEEDPPVHRYGRVFVAPPEQARGRTFAVVFAPGLAERMFPQRPREDPLLLDTYRSALSPALPTQAERGQRERQLLRLVVGAARERIYLSYPSVDVVEARPRVTSFYGLDVERATRGTIPDIEDLARRAAGETSARLSWPAPPDAERAIDPVEHDLSTLWRLLHQTDLTLAKGHARYLLELNAHLARSLRARFARWELERWSELDGLVRRTEATARALDAHRLGARAYSVSALEKFAACPYRFALMAIHRLEPRKQITAPEQLDPLTRGRLFHRVQAETLQTLRADGLLPLDASVLENADAILLRTLDRVAAQYRDELNPPILRVWHDEVDALRTDLIVWLRHLCGTGAAWHPKYFELGFGLPAGEERDPESVRESVTLPGGAILRGCVDLVEKSAAGSTLRVTDHKTGADRTSAGLVVGGGETLQPVLYALAVEAALGETVSEARLFFCTSRGGFAERMVPIDQRARAQGREVLDIIGRAIADGFLPPAPREEACRLCDFRIVCGPYEEERVHRKDQKQLADLVSLRGRP